MAASRGDNAVRARNAVIFPEADKIVPARLRFTALVAVSVKLPPVAVLVIASAVQLVNGSEISVLVSTVKTPPVMQLATVENEMMENS
jgi:hypothetical protein